MSISRYLNNMLNNPMRGLQVSLLMLMMLVALGAVGYMIIERMTMFDALYMTIITITTVGFGEVSPLSAPGRAFTALLIVTGVVTATTALGNATSILLGQHLWQSLRERRMIGKLAAMRGHYIICGYGRMGKQVVRDLQARAQPFVIIEKDLSSRELLLNSETPHLIGDATDDEILRRAGILSARGLVTALDSDSDNIMTVLSARELKPDLLVVARATNSEAERKLRRAGADRVISPWQAGGHRMAVALLKPAVHDFIDLLLHPESEHGTELGQIVIEPGSALADRSVAEVDLRRSLAVTMLGIRLPDGEITLNPSPQRVLRPGEVLICIGPPEAIRRVEAVPDM